jgi:6-phospho-beta-glucosidase
VKLAVIGGGSTYTPEVVDGLVRLRALLPVDELWLHDTNAERLEVVAGLARRMLARASHPARLAATTRLDDAADGADAVLIQIRVGGQAARMVDESVPVACGCLGQETTGFGGLAKALRTVPVVLEIAERARERAPDAWIVDFTNPVGIVTRALLDAGHRAVGLCSAAMVFQRHFAKLLAVDPARVELDHLGLNHLTWEVGVRLDGEDVLARLLDEQLEPVARATGLPAELVRRLGTVPSYYLHYFYEHDEVVEEQRRSTSRAQLVSEIEAELLELYADETLDDKPELLRQRGGAGYSEAAVELIASLLGSAGEGRHVVNLRNEGALPFLADEAVVEVPALVGRAGVRHAPLAEAGSAGGTAAGGRGLSALERGLVAHVSAYEELALEAALRGGRERVFRALLAHPLVGQAALADELTDKLLAANKDFLAWV